MMGLIVPTISVRVGEGGARRCGGKMKRKIQGPSQAADLRGACSSKVPLSLLLVAETGGAEEGGGEGEHESWVDLSRAWCQGHCGTEMEVVEKGRKGVEEGGRLMLACPLIARAELCSRKMSASTSVRGGRGWGGGRRKRVGRTEEGIVYRCYRPCIMIDMVRIEKMH